MPNKTKILPLLDELAPAAQFAGAVNTVVNEDGKLIGHITRWYRLCSWFKRNWCGH